MNENLSAPWLFIIDTEDYAGNFERDLCAYITGRVGECGVGDEEAKLFEEETGFEGFDNVVEEADERGCYRPASIYPTIGWFNNGFGGGFKEGQEEKALMEYRKAKAAYHRNSCYVKYWEEWQKDPNSHERYIKAGWNEKKLKKAAADEEKEAKKAEKETKVNKYTCYHSVAISFNKKPTKKQIDLMKERAQKFAQLPDRWQKDKTKISKITGFRLIENIIERKSKEQTV